MNALARRPSDVLLILLARKYAISESVKFPVTNVALSEGTAEITLKAKCELKIRVLQYESH